MHLHSRVCSFKKLGEQCDTQVIYNSRKWMGQEIALIPISNLAPSEVRDDVWREWNELNEDFPTSGLRPSGERAFFGAVLVAKWAAYGNRG